MRTNGRRGRGARAPIPKKTKAMTPKSVFGGPDFNNPPSVAAPRPKPAPKPKPAKRGPYTKPTPRPTPKTSSSKSDSQAKSDYQASKKAYAKKRANPKYIGGIVNPQRGQGGGTVSVLKDVGNSIIAGNPIMAGESAIAHHLTHPLAAVRAQAESQLGPDIPAAISGGDYSKAGLGIGLASLIPGWRPLKEARIIGETAKALHEGASLAEAKAIARAHVSRLPADRNVPMVGRVLSSPQKHIRVVQKALDKNIQKTIERGAVKGLEPSEALAQSGLRSKAAAKRVAHLRESHGTGGFYQREGAQAAPKALAHVKLKPEQYVAMRQMAHNINPDVELKAINTRLTEAILSGHKDAIRALHRDYQLVEESKKYLVGKGTGVEWRPGTPKRIKLVWDDLVRGSQNAEDLHIRLGEISPEIAAARIHKPGEFTLAKADYQGYAPHEGRLYYRSKEATKVIQGQRGWSPAGWIKPNRPARETRQAYQNALRESGMEDINIPKVVGQTELRRTNVAMAEDLLKEIRPYAIEGTLPKTGDVYNDYRAIPLFDNPNSEARRKFLSAVDEAVSHPEMDLKEIENLQELHQQVLKELSMQVHHPPPGYGFVHKSLVAALEDPKLLRRGNLNKAQRFMMNASSLVKDMVVYSKIGHMPPRLASNMLMVMPDAGRDFLPAMFALRKIYKADPSITKWIHEAMGGGYFKSFAETTGLPSKTVQNISKHAVGWIEYTADRAPRNIAFLSFAMKDSGARDVPTLLRYIRGLRDARPGSEEWAARNRVLTHARQAAGEYNRVGGDASVGNIIFLYRWLKTSTIWTSRFIAKHPLQAAALGYAVDKYVYQPDNPAWDRFNVGGHNIQTSLPFSTPVEIGERLHNTVNSGLIPLGGGLLDQLNPFVEIIANIAGHKNIETGNDLPMGSYPGAAFVSGLQQFAKQTPPGALVWGKHTWHDKILKFIGGNPVPTSHYPGAYDDLKKYLQDHGMSKEKAKKYADNLQKQADTAQRQAKDMQKKMQDQIKGISK